MRSLDLTPDSDGDANQLAKFAASPAGQAQIAKLANAANAAQRGLAKALSPSVLDTVLANREYLAASATPVFDALAASREYFADMASASTVLSDALSAYETDVLGSLSKMVSESVARYPWPWESPLAALTPSEISAYESFRSPHLPVVLPPAREVDAHDIEELQNEVAELHVRVRRAEDRAQRAEHHARNAEAVAKEAKLRLARELPPLWAGDPPNDSNHPADQVN